MAKTLNTPETFYISMFPNLVTPFGQSRCRRRRGGVGLPGVGRGDAVSVPEDRRTHVVGGGFLRHRRGRDPVGQDGGRGLARVIKTQLLKERDKEGQVAQPEKNVVCGIL